MKNKLKDRLGDVILIVVFLAVIGGAAYAIIKTMTKWSIKGLGY
jgi:hypothetical protein